MPNIRFLPATAHGDMAAPTPLVTIVIPVYNEEDVIVNTLTTLTSFLTPATFPYPYHIVVVDNASTDRTAELVTEYAATHPAVALLSLVEKGKGRAIRAAWEKAPGDILAFMDADLSSDLSSFAPLVDAVAAGRAQLAIGNRLGKHSKIVTTKKLRKVVSRVFNALVRLFLHTGIDDHQCGFKAISSTAFTTLEPRLTENEFFIDTELIAYARMQGFYIHQEDIIWIDRATSKVSLVKDSLAMFLSILRLSWRLHL